MWCPQCGATLRENSPVCDNCGAAVSADMSASQSEPFASSSSGDLSGSQPPMRAPKLGRLSPMHAPDSTTTLGSLDPAAEAEWDAGWPPVDPIMPTGAGGMPPMPPMPEMPGMSGMSGMPDMNAQRAPFTPSVGAPSFGAPASRIQTPHLQAPPPGEPRSPFWPDNGTGLGNNVPMDPNLPAWLFERPDQWESPSAAAGATSMGVADAWPATPAGMPAGQQPAATGQQGGTRWDPQYGFDPPSAPGWGAAPAAPPASPPPAWKTLRDAIPPDPPPTGDAWPDDDPSAGLAARPRGRFAGIRLPKRLTVRPPGRPRLRAAVPAAAPAVAAPHPMAAPPPQYSPGAPPPQYSAGAPPPQYSMGVPPQPATPRRAPVMPRGRAPVRSIRLPWSRGKARTPTLTENLARGAVVARDTGRGWRVVMPVVDPNASAGAGWMAPAPVRVNRPLSVIGGLTRWTFNLLLLAIILAILAIPIGIGIIRLHNAPQAKTIEHPTPTVAPAPTPYAGYKTFEGSSAGFTLSYPTSWTQQPASLTVPAAGDMQGEAFKTGSNATLVVLSRSAISSSNLTNMLNGGYLPITSGQVASYSPLTTPAPGPVLAGVPWQNASYTFDLAGVPMRAKALVANHGVWTYLVVYQAPQGQFAGLESQNFDPMLNSLRLLG